MGAWGIMKSDGKGTAPAPTKGTTKMTTTNPGCQWFALCDNPATDTRPGPQVTPNGLEMIQIPVCDRCADRAN